VSTTGGSRCHIDATARAQREERLKAAFENIARSGTTTPLTIEARQIRAGAPAASSGSISPSVQWTSVAQRLSGDHRAVHTVLSNIPQMSAGQASEARRFTWLVDVLYDHRVKLLASAEVAPERLYTSGALAGEFARTASRLLEMQSREYLESPRRSVASF
jgi:cell division protein ZapE